MRRFKLLRKRPTILLIMAGGGLLATLVMVMVARITSPAMAQAAGSVYEMAAGETLPQVAARFSLDPRTLRCVNPDWQTSQTRLVLPLVSARRYSVPASQTLGGVAQLYGVAPEVITGYPLNFWEGCPGVAGLGQATAATTLPEGLLLYIPDPQTFVTEKVSGLPNGTQALGDDYTAEDQPNAALTNPEPPAFQLPAEINPTVMTLLTPTVAAAPTVVAAPTPTPRPTTATRPTRSAVVVSSKPNQVVLDSSGGGLPSNFQAATGRPIIWPLRGVITTYFSAGHPAIDIATSLNTPVYAAQSGVVFYAAFSPYGYGNFIQIDHGDGRHTHYAHLNKFAVGVGQYVSQGQLIGYEGSTGNSTGPHLHFELVINGHYVDPLQYLPK